MSGGTFGINKKWWPKVKGGSHEGRPIVIGGEFDDWSLITGGTHGIGGDNGYINTAKETI